MELDSEASTSQGPALPSTSSPRSNGAASGAADVEGGKGRGSGKASGRARGKGRDKGKGRGQRDGQDGAAADGAGLTLVEKLALSPYSSELHLASIAAATSDNEREEARAFMAQMVPLTEEQWMEWIKDRKLQIGTSLEGKVEILELYKRACSDSLSIKLHQKYAQFVLSIFFGARGYAFPEVLQEEESTPDGALFDEGAAAVFDQEFVDGEMLAAVDQSVRWHLAEGQSVWLTLHNYEIFRLKHAPTEEAVSRMEQVYLERLSEPHLQISQTHQLYSTFISTYKNRDYEESMVASQPIYAASKALVDVRELQEDRLASASLSVESYQTYLAWEQEVAKPHFLLVKVLYERALNQFSHDTSLWQAYTTFLLTASRRPSSVTGVEDSGWSPDMLLEVYNRAVRWLPFAGEMISACVMGTELLYGVETALAFGQEQYDRVIGANETGMTLEDLTSVVIAYADSVRHAELELAEEARPTSQLVTVLESGIAKVRSLAPDTGDAHMRIEKYLLRQYERSGNTTAVDALLASLAQSYATSAVVLITRTEYLLRQNKVDTVRKLFQAAAKKRYDYPEFVFDAWANFEHRDGTLATLDKALATIKHEMTFVEARRLRENRLQLAASDEIHIEREGSQPASLDTSSGQDVSSKKRRLGGDPAEGIAVGASAAIDASNNGSSTKQGAFLGMCMTIEVRVLTKLVRKEEVLPQELKRDRENSTISVTGLSLGVDEDAIKRLFRDCGAIREVKSKVINDRAVATVEFVNRDSVPAALTKDKKRIEGHEVQVSPVWQSTLYVTNFPEQFDAADVQKLFEPFGTIFETRWPSRRLKSTRRFVYVQYTEADAAQKALALHNTVVEEGSDQRLQVKISDPQHKQARTDANATKRELYITGLPRSATESDLEKLFAPFGALRACRVLKDDNGQCRGAGFVDFETEQSTSAALSMNNHEFKKRRLAVVLADSRLTQKAKVAASGQGQRADTRNRSIKATGFPLDAQEPLVQQFFDRYGPTTGVELQGETAVVTFANPADAAKLLLGASQVDYEGHAVTLEEPRTRANRESADHKGLPTPAGVVPFLPRANRGRGRKVGIGARRPTHGMDVDPVNNADERVGNIPVQGDASQSKNRSQADFKALLLSKSSS